MSQRKSAGWKRRDKSKVTLSVSQAHTTTKLHKAYHTTEIHANMKIFIKGIKTIRDGQFVALGKKLTFLVGPNSAGKSTLITAMENIERLFSKEEIDENIIYHNPNKNSDGAGIYGIGLENILRNQKQTQIAFVVSGACEKECTDSTDFGSAINSRATIKTYDRDYFSTTYRNDYYLNDRLLLRTDIDADNSLLDHFLPFSHQTSDDLGNALFSLNAMKEDVRKKFEEYVESTIEILEGTLTEIDPNGKNSAAMIEGIHKLTIEITKRKSEGFFLWNYRKSKVAASCLAGKNRQRAFNILDKIQSSSLKYFRNIKNSHFPHRGLSISVVSAQRTLPSPVDCELFFALDHTPKNIYHTLIMDGHQLASPLHQHRLNKTELENLELGGGTLFHEVNKALSENLFTDNGYQIKIDAKILLDPKDLVSEDLPTKDSLLEGVHFYGKLNLIDCHGRELDFKDVGSGIGYVLPILIEVFNSKTTNSAIVLQQPELHLHPALQANLTDVLIEAAKAKKIIAETHSEHMILRALKRIRQTTSGTLSDPLLSLTSEDVTVNYFEPLPDGTTRIHILRIADDGEFIDRWPNGFFAEREQELFDE